MSKRMMTRMATRAGIERCKVTTTGRASTLPLADGGRLSWCPLPHEAGSEAQWSWGRYDSDGRMVADGGAENGTWLIADLARQVRLAPAA